jgi:hypothetical protein
MCPSNMSNVRDSKNFPDWVVEDLDGAIVPEAWLSKISANSEFQKVWALLKNNADRFPDRRPATSFFLAVGYGLNATSIEHGLTKKERSADAKRVAKLCDDLLDALRSITADHGGLLPHYVRWELGKLGARRYGNWARYTVDGLQSSIACEMPDKPHSAKLKEVVRDHRYASFDVFTSQSEDVAALLKSLRAGAAAWGNAPQLIPKPNDPGTRRAYFVRHMTYFFVEHLQGPRRDETCIIANTLFDDMPELTTDAAAGLAPDESKRRSAPEAITRSLHS